MFRGARYRNTRQTAHSYLTRFPSASRTHIVHGTQLPIPLLSPSKRTGPLRGLRAEARVRRHFEQVA